MNKYVLVTLVILLAVQGLDAQFLSGIISLFTSVGGFVFNSVLSVPYTIISFAATFTVIVSNATLATLSLANAGAYNSLIRINNFTNNVNNITSYYNSLLQDRSNTATFFGRTVVGNLYDAINGIGYTTNGLSAIVIGCRPSQPPPISYLNTYYPLPDSCLSTTNCTNTTIACAARNFINLAQYQINNINTTALYLQWLAEDFGSNDTINATVDAEIIIEQWANLSAMARFYLTVNSQGSLLTYADPSFNANFTAVMNQMVTFMNNINATTSELLNSTNILYFSINDFGRLQRYQILSEIFQNRSRRWAYINSLIGYNTFRSNVNNALTSLNNTAYQFVQAINGISPSGYVYKTTQTHSSAFQNLTSRLNSSLSTFLTDLNARIEAVEQSKSNLILNATQALNGTFSDFIESVLNDNVTDCLNFTAPASDAYADFALGIQACGQNTDIDTQTINTNATSIFNNFMSSASAFMNTSNSCFSYACQGNLGYPFATYGVRCANDNTFFRCTTWLPPFFYNCPTTKSNYLNTCLSNLNTAINSFVASADSSVNSTLSLLRSSINSALTELNTCINNQVNATNIALDAISADYNNCKTSQAA
ncbi:unnamed protein product [Chironomus riparius]|uniref:Spike glycoprotein n=1 Tax=Chironomus riparius TaxID=315576 RepID=A0A9N9WV92_9DIPT|nr:unnamed protein product [Chironomus riparius]